MTRAVLSIGSNMGDRMAWLQSAVDALSEVLVVSPVYETDPWGGVEQGSFLNAVLVAEDPACDARGWLCRAQAVERAAGRVHGERWGPRTLDVDVIACYETGSDGPRNQRNQVVSHESDLILPHPRAHLRAFVLVPWLVVDPAAELMVAEGPRSVTRLLADLEPADLAGVRLFELALHLNGKHRADPKPES